MASYRVTVTTEDDEILATYVIPAHEARSPLAMEYYAKSIADEINRREDHPQGD